TAPVTAFDTANYTGATPSITIDKQISINGGAWQGIARDMTDPGVLAGSAVAYQVVVSNTSAAGISETVSVTDSPTLPSGFTFGLGDLTSVTLAGGASLTSNVVTTTASVGYQPDTATVSGTASDS